MMYPRKCCITILQLIFICYVNSQFISTAGMLQSSSLSKPQLPERITKSYDISLTKPTTTHMFVETFVRAVTESNNLNQIFNIKLSIDEMMKIYFQAFSEALVNVDVEDPAAVAKTISDAIKDTYPRMSENVIAYATANAVIIYLLSEGFDLKLAETNATAFAGAILQRYHLNKNPCPLDLVRALSNGINDFLLPFKIYTPSRLPVVPISFAKQFYTMTDIAEPIISEGEIFSLSANTALGIKRFTGNFLKEIAASPTLKNVFNFTETIDRVSKVWNHAIRIECARLKSPLYRINAISNRFSRALSDTFDTKSLTGFAVDFACGYALYAMSQGYFTQSTLITLPKELARSIENSSSLNADLFAKVSAIINAYKVLSNNHVELKYSEKHFSAILYYTGSEFYGSSKIQRPLSDSIGV